MVILKSISWSFLNSLAKDVYAKVSIGVVFIYAAYYGDKMGIDVDGLRITLGGYFLLILSVIFVKAAAPRLIKEYDSAADFELNVHKRIRKKYVSIVYYENLLGGVVLDVKLVSDLGYRFDDGFSFDVEDLKTTLSDKGFLSFVAHYFYCSNDISKPVCRFFAFVFGLLGFFLISFKVVCMAVSIYFVG